MDPRIAHVCDTVASGPTRKWKAKELAVRVRLSERQLRNLFMRAHGSRVSAFVRRIRMEHAALMLRTSFLSIKEVASLLDTHPSRFCKDFSVVHGCTPTVYRRTANAHAIKSDVGSFKRQ